MSNTTVLNIKIDPKLKRQVQEVAKALGLPVSTLVTASLRDIVQRRSITISDEPPLRPEVQEELLRLSKNAREGKDLSPVFTNAKDAIAWLRAGVEASDKE
jgi:addiction module RelB/DinJ family antitoxin